MLVILPGLLLETDEDGAMRLGLFDRVARGDGVSRDGMSGERPKGVSCLSLPGATFVVGAEFLGVVAAWADAADDGRGMPILRSLAGREEDPGVEGRDFCLVGVAGGVAWAWLVVDLSAARCGSGLMGRLSLGPDSGRFCSFLSSSESLRRLRVPTRTGCGDGGFSGISEGLTADLGLYLGRAEVGRGRRREETDASDGDLTDDAPSSDEVRAIAPETRFLVMIFGAGSEVVAFAGVRSRAAEVRGW